mmetsp:Transcript_30082/g.54117  ORF Transcript_30082/g.54117 Transcript_30082/m.54117 type:complete len:83 (-) Transcript_30082:996-1244(-)
MKGADNLRPSKLLQLHLDSGPLETDLCHSQSNSQRDYSLGDDALLQKIFWHNTWTHFTRFRRNCGSVNLLLHSCITAHIVFQ